MDHPVATIRIVCFNLLLLVLNVQLAALAAAAEPVGHVPRGVLLSDSLPLRVGLLPSGRDWVRVCAATGLVLRGLVKFDRV